MKKNESEIAYELLCRFDGLINSVKAINDTFPKGTPIRLKPFFISYNSCIDAFRHSFPKQYGLLNLEPLPLRDKYGNGLSTIDKISTLLHQSEAVLAQLKGLSPYEFRARPTSARESWGWYRHNTHISLIIYFLGIIFFVFLSGLYVADTTLYKNTIKPFVSEYMSLKTYPQKNTTATVPPAQNTNKK